MIHEKSYEGHTVKITLRAEPAPGQYRPTRQDEESQNQEEYFAPCEGYHSCHEATGDSP